MFLKPYQTLKKALGPSHWWPGENSFEIMVGAILTQNTSWKNVEKAIHRLKKEKALSPKKMHRTPVGQLAEWIRSSGYFNQKALTLHRFLDWYAEYNYRPAQILKKHNSDSHPVRRELLSVKGIGPETADSILCYGLELPVFVVDAYTHRWLSRYDSGAGRAASGSYNLVQQMVQADFGRHFSEAELTAHYNEFHALIVRLGNGFCKKTGPLCKECPLRGECENALA
ncbi:MAG: hypothetical protein RH862_11020 [Leptospiraceae bacterium]